MIDVDVITTQVRPLLSLLTEAGRAQLETVVLVADQVQGAHAEAMRAGIPVLVVVPVRMTPLVRLWAWHVAYPAGGSTSYEWGGGPTLGWALRLGARAAGRRASMLRHPSSRHAD